MRKIIILVLLLLISLFASIIVVDERQNVVITGYKGVQVVKSAGIHIAWPVVQKVRYVFMNERTSLLTLSVNESEVANTPLQLEVLINYHVINPIDYVGSVDKYGKVGISELIAKYLILDLKTTIGHETLIKFNQNPHFVIQQNSFIPLGINIDQVNLLSIKYIPDEKK